MVDTKDLILFVRWPLHRRSKIGIWTCSDPGLQVLSTLVFSMLSSSVGQKTILKYLVIWFAFALSWES